MKKVLPWLGWGVALVAVALLLYTVKETLEARKKLALAAMSAKEAATASETQRRELEARLAELRNKLRDLQARPAGPKRETPAAETPQTPEESFDGGELEAETDKPEAEESENQIREKNLLRVQMGAMTDMAYKPFFDEMNFTDEVRAAVRDALTEFGVTRQQRQNDAFRRGDVSARSVRADRDLAMETLRGRLQLLLSADQFAQWQAYEPDSNRILFEGILEGQLNMLASDLTAENLQLVRETMAEELARYLDQFENSDELYTLANFNQAQARALQDSLESLGEALDEDQLSLVQGFVDQAMAMFAAVGQ